MQPLDGVNVFQQLGARQCGLGIAQARVGAFFDLEERRRGFRPNPARVDTVEDPIMPRLPGDSVDDGVDSVCLILLDLELKLHRASLLLTYIYSLRVPIYPSGPGVDKESPAHGAKLLA
ncbi:hypothetical protein ACH0BO_11195 [Brevibacterium luteolum]|uniref:hypothetical protein n=1 Tax=Brevibacterium luteolum TaxID=199591 RepID=UPI0038799390